jgi:hypothetical protein
VGGVLYLKSFGELLNWMDEEVIKFPLKKEERKGRKR